MNYLGIIEKFVIYMTSEHVLALFHNYNKPKEILHLLQSCHTASYMLFHIEYNKQFYKLW